MPWLVGEAWNAPVGAAIPDPECHRFRHVLQQSPISAPGGFARDGDLIYLSSDGSFLVLDVSDPDETVIVGSVTNAVLNSDIGRMGVAHNGAGLAYVANSGAFSVIDVSTPATPTILGSDTDADFVFPTAVVYDGVTDHCYVSVDSGLLVVDVSTPSAPNKIAAALDSDNFGEGSALAKVGDRCYVPNGSGGMGIFDVSTPGAPVYQGLALGNKQGYQGTYGVVADDDDNIWVSYDGNNKLVSFDLESHTPMETLGRVDDTQLNTSVSLVRSGNTLVAGALSANRVTTVDVSTPSVPVILGSVQDATNLAGVRALDINGSTVYAAATNRLTTVSIATPSTPTILGSVSNINLGSTSSQIAYGNNHVFYPTGTGSRLYAINVTTPATPSVAGFLAHANLAGVRCCQYDAANALLYCGTISGRFTVVDVSTPATPTHVASITHALISQTVRMVYDPVDQVCYINTTTGDTVLVVIDVSTPSSPAVIGSVDEVDDWLGTSSIDYASGLVCAMPNAATGPILVVDVSIPSTPVIVGRWEGHVVNSTEVLIDGANARAWVSWNSVGGTPGHVTGVDLSAPDDLGVYATLIGEVTGLDDIAHLARCGDTIVGATSEESTSGLIHEVDISNVATPALIETHLDPRFAEDSRGVDTNCDRIFIASTGHSAFVTIDPDCPYPTDGCIDVIGTVTDATTLSSGSFWLDAAGNYAYESTNFARLTVIDVSTPTAPNDVGTLQDSTNLSGLNGIAVDGTVVYGAVENADRFVVINVATPSSPAIIGNITSTQLNGAKGLAHDANGLAFVTASIDDRLVVVDVSTPSAPSIVGSVQHATQLNVAQRVAYQADLCYVTARESPTIGRLTIVDVSTPTAPSIVGSLGSALLVNAGPLVVDGDYAYVIGEDRAYVTIIDISTPSTPVIVGRVVDGFIGQATGVVKGGDVLYIANREGTANFGSGGIAVITVADPTAPRLLYANMNETNALNPRLITRSNELLFITAQGNRFTVLDSTPCAPASTGWTL